MGNSVKHEVQDISDPNKENIIVSVFFCGTGGTIKGETTQIGFFAKSCAASDDITDGSNHFKFYFDGCGVTNGMMGTIFASGLHSQCSEVVEKCEKILEQKNKRITLNVLGLSRGGIACLILANKLYNYRDIDINLFLFDPVPGNSITSGTFDILYQTTAYQNIDLTSSINLKNVVALYPYEPLPDLAFHAPLISKFPSYTNVHLDIILGCHQGALFYPSEGADEYYLDKGISFFIIKETMEKWGSIFEGKRMKSLTEYWTPERLLKGMNNEMKSPSKSLSINFIRHCHSTKGVKIIRRKEGTYLNRFHESLYLRLNEVNSNPPSKHNYVLDFK